MLCDDLNGKEIQKRGEFYTCGLSRWLSGKESTCPWRRQETEVRSLGQEDPREKEMATHSSILAWKIRWTEEPGGLQSSGLQSLT